MCKKTMVTLAALVLAAGALPANAHEQVVGTLLGAGIGAAVGHGMGGSDGAVVGGLVGAVAGAALTNDYRERAHYPEPVAVETGRYYVPEPRYVHGEPAVVYAERVAVERPRHWHRWWHRDRWDRHERHFGSRHGPHDRWH